MECFVNTISINLPAVFHGGGPFEFIDLGAISHHQVCLVVYLLEYELYRLVNTSSPEQQLHCGFNVLIFVYPRLDDFYRSGFNTVEYHHRYYKRFDRHFTDKL